MQNSRLISKPERTYRKTIVALALLGTLVAGCNTGSSDALNVMQSNADATIGALNSSLGTAQITLTAMSTMATQLAQAQDAKNTLQAEYDQVITQLNGNPAPTLAALNAATPAPVLTPSGQNTLAPLAGSGPTSQPPNGFTMDSPVTARGYDNSNGCPVNSSTSFSTADAKIYVVVKVHNLKKGMVFNASWTGTPQHQDSWTATYSAAVTCIHFFVDPKALGMVSGTWTVSLGLADATAKTVDFALQDAAVLPATAAAK